MGLRNFLFFLLLSQIRLILAEDVTVTVKSVTNIATTDDNFVCTTIDWWPSGKCNYDMCPWGKAGLFTLDLNNKILRNAIKEFNPMRIRIGGSLQDQILYKVGHAVKKCPHLKNDTDGLFGFSKACLTMDKWDEVNHMLNDTGAIVTFGLNALFGRKKMQNDTSYFGHWNSRNAYDLVKYTKSKGYNIESWELGNELSGGGVSAKVDAEQYAKDATALKNLLKELYKDSSSVPKVLGPGGFYDEQWFTTFLRASGPDVVDVVTHHIYNLGPGVDPNLIYRVQDPFYLDQITQTYKDVEKWIQNYPWSSAWIGESGGAYNSGGRDVSHTYVNSFWFLDQLGMASTFNHKVFCRQSLIGGNYGLLNTTTFVPNPDYYSALLWQRLMGKHVLETTHNGSPYLRAYAHCSKDGPGVSLLLINLSNSTTYEVSVANDLNFYPASDNSGSGQAREEYHLTPKDSNLLSDVMLLNGSPLVLTEKLSIPKMYPLLVDPAALIKVTPDSIVFATLRDFQAPACA